MPHPAGQAAAFTWVSSLAPGQMPLSCRKSTPVFLYLYLPGTQMPSRSTCEGGVGLPENVGSTGTIEIKKEDKHSCSLEVLDGSTHA